MCQNSPPQPILTCISTLKMSTLASMEYIMSHMYAFQITCKLYTFFYFRGFLMQLADEQCSSISKDSIYHQTYSMSNIVHTTSYHGTGLTWNWIINGSVLMFDSYTYCVFTLYEKYVNFLICTLDETNYWTLVKVHCFHVLHVIWEIKGTSGETTDDGCLLILQELVD